MRDVTALALMGLTALIAALLSRMLKPAGGRHSGAPHVPQHIPTPPPATTPAARQPKPWTGPSSAQARAIFHAEEVRKLTPEQRERWWATAFAEIGVEYPYTYPGAQTYRRGAAA
ncbi:hypothetical protein [Streptomyces sp. NPDC001404]|uniref:hypothetical protein n=1 Tax=Streptomyces sp. NPDC001404 TaxID=3364571 RepID=UPI0036CA5577